MLTTLVRLKTMLGIPQDDASQDGELNLLIPVASEMIETYCRRSFGRDTYVETLESSGGRHLILRNYPVQSVASTQQNGVPMTGYDLIAEKGMLHYQSSPVRGRIRVEYTAGYILPKDETVLVKSDLPSTIEYAVALLIKHLMREPGVISERVGDISVTYANEGDKMPAAVKALIAPYRNVNL